MRRRFLAVAAGLTAATSATAQPPETLPHHVTVPSYVAPAPVAAEHSATQTLVAEPGVGNADRGLWASAEYLVWYTRSMATPQLIVSVPDAVAVAGNQVPAGTRVQNLYPGNGRQIEFGAQSGVRARIGGCINDCYGFDIGGFVLENQDARGTFGSTGSPALARAYTRALDGTQQFLYSAIPGQYGGRISVFAETELWGIDGNVRLDWYRLIVDHNDLLFGFRYLNLEERLVINDRSDLPGGVTNTVRDSFRTQNHFYGPQVGLNMRIGNYGGFSLETVTKLGVGGMQQRIEISGANTLTGRADQATGLYAQGSNSGSFSRSIFAFVGEVTVNLGYSITPNVRAFVGYNMLYLSNVVRPGQALDQTVNDSTIRYIANPPADPRNRRPNIDFGRASNDFWAQGLNVGLSFMY